MGITNIISWLADRARQIIVLSGIGYRELREIDQRQNLEEHHNYYVVPSAALGAVQLLRNARGGGGSAECDTL